MKSLVTTLLLLIGFSLNAAPVIKADANNIQDDLNFKLQSTPKKYQRSLASEKVKESEKEKIHDEKDHKPESKRDIANQPEVIENGVKYWAY